MADMRRDDERGGSFVFLGPQQAAQFFRNGVRGCQFEGGRMRWWSACGLYRLEQVGPTGWRLYVVPTRGGDG
jgi:hypothetical protein